MRKNKTIAYALAATLLVGGTFAGTKAWFTASGEVDSGLVVTTGSMGLEVTEENNWTVITPKGDKTEITNKDNKNDFKNVKPGDDFEKSVTIKNIGSLNQVLDVTGGEINNSNPNFLVKLVDDQGQSINNLSEYVGTELASSGAKTFKIVVETVEKEMKSSDADIINDGENGVDDEARKFDLTNVMSKLVINAKQTNDNRTNDK